MRRLAFVPFIAAAVFTGLLAWCFHGIDQAIRKVHCG